MKKLFSLLLVLALMAGCGGVFSGGLYGYRSVAPEANNQHFQVKPVFIDKTFNADELATINKVVQEWNFVLNGYLVYKIEPDAFDHTDAKALRRLAKKIGQTHEGIMIVGADHDDELLEESIDEYDGTLAFVNNLGERAHFMAVIRDRMGYKNLHKILLHEFGHAMGAHHVNTESLMFPYYGSQQRDCVDKITGAQVATYYKLKLEHINFCLTPNFE